MQTRLPQMIRYEDIRWMIRRDVPAVVDIETRSFEFPWSEEDFVRQLRSRNCIGMVAELDERILGFMVYELHRGYLQVHDFAVDPDHRRQGIGRAMIDRLKSKLTPSRRNKLRLNVRESNLPALAFFRAQQFRATGILRGFYDDSPEDAYAMQFHLNRPTKE